MAASLVIITDDAPLFGTRPVNGSGGLIIGYHRATAEGTEQLPSMDEAFLHVGYLNVSDSGLGIVPFCVEGTDVRHCFDENVAPIRSVILNAQSNASYSFRAWVENTYQDLVARDGRTSFALTSNYSFIDVLSFPPSPTAYFRDSAPLGHTTFAIFRDSQILISTSATVISNLFDVSLGTSASDEFYDSTIFPFSFSRTTYCFKNSAPLGHTTFATFRQTWSFSSSVRDIRQTEGSSAARIISLVIASLVILIIAGVAIVVIFRRQTALLTDSDTTTPSNSVTGRIPCPPTANGLVSLAPGRGHPPGSPTAHQVTEGNARLCEEDEFDVESAFPESQYREADLLE
jgi:hypothetical protein